MTIKTNDIIRSFDFDDAQTTGPRACFMEGRVIEVDGNVIRFEPSRVVFKGEDDPAEEVEARGIITTRINTWRGNRLEDGTLVVL